MPKARSLIRLGFSGLGLAGLALLGTGSPAFALQEPLNTWVNYDPNPYETNCTQTFEYGESGANAYEDQAVHGSSCYISYGEPVYYIGSNLYTCGYDGGNNIGQYYYNQCPNENIFGAGFLVYAQTLTQGEQVYNYSVTPWG